MKLDAKKLFLAAFVASCALPVARAQMSGMGNVPAGSGTNFTASTYFEPPNDQVVEVRLTGAEMSPLPGALYDVKQLKIEKFGTNGILEAVASAPRCVYSPLDGFATSAGHLDLDFVSTKGRLHTQGEGFYWQQKEQSLVISNNVYTVFKTKTWKLTLP